MAISAPLYQLLSSTQVAPGASILEFGEANWYGDIDPHKLFACEHQCDPFEVVKSFYRHWCQPSAVTSIDLDPHRPQALKFDLNRSFAMDRAFDVVINHGTMEHVFNVAQFLLSMHRCCADGGLMIHDAPFTGWIDHGFYCFQPTLFYDLALANRYEVVKAAVYDINSRIIFELSHREHVVRLASNGGMPNNSMIYFAMRKHGAEPFRMPQQGFYAGVLSQQAVNAWRVLR